MAIYLRALPEIERNLKELGMQAVHYHVYVALSEAPARTLRLSDLAAHANISQSRLTHRLRLLVDRGDVTIATCPEDSRAKNATLTDAGFARLEAVAPDHARTVLELIFDGLTPAQTKALGDATSAVATELYCHPEFLNPNQPRN